jgi:hypothetical protein
MVVVPPRCGFRLPKPAASRPSPSVEQQLSWTLFATKEAVPYDSDRIEVSKQGSFG